MQPKVLDLCCGLGGWADGFLAAGYEVHGYDIIDVGHYPGNLHVQDIRTLDPEVWAGQIDVLVASPPCQEFSANSMP